MPCYLFHSSVEYLVLQTKQLHVCSLVARAFKLTRCLCYQKFRGCVMMCARYMTQRIDIADVPGPLVHKTMQCLIMSRLCRLVAYSFFKILVILELAILSFLPHSLVDLCRKR